MTNFDKYLDALNYFECFADGTIYRKERKWLNNGTEQVQPRRLCSTSTDGSGYETVSVMLNGKNFRPKVHLLIKLYFDGLPNDIELEKLQVDHVDGNKHNNKLNNLEWVTINENMKRAYKNGLNYVSEEQRKERSYRMKKNNPMKNKDIATKVSDKNKGKINKNRKKVIQLSLTDEFVKEYESVSSAIQETKINNIPAALSGKQNKAGGYKWTYKQ